MYTYSYPAKPEIPQVVYEPQLNGNNYQIKYVNVVVKTTKCTKNNKLLLTKRNFSVIIIYVNLVNRQAKAGKIMKRVKAACITQTLHFLLKEDVGQEYAKKLVTEEVKKYKDSLDKNKTQYKILSEETKACSYLKKGNCTLFRWLKER